MGNHVTADTVGRLRRHEVPADELLPALRHIAECSQCAALASFEMSDDIARTQELLAAEAAEQPHLDEAELFGLVDGTLDDDTRAFVRAHLDTCAGCREDAADLRRLHPTRRVHPAWIGLAAASIAVALLSILLVGRNPPAPPPISPDRPVVTPDNPVPIQVPAHPPYATAEWNALVNGALASSRLPFPGDLALLRGEAESLRGETIDGDDTLRNTLWPMGVYVDAVRPVLSWPAGGSSATYVVTIMEGDDEVVHSPELRRPRWTPPRPLARGHTYTWQVEVSRDGSTDVLPSPSAPPAMFRIVRAADHEALTAARERHPDDHLLLAVLCARAGMEAEAKEHLARLAVSADPRIQRLRSTTR